MDLFSQALFGWDYFAKIEAKMFAKQAQNFLKCSRINLTRLDRLCNKFFAGKSSSFADLLATT
jgi:hypothetical protein